MLREARRHYEAEGVEISKLRSCEAKGLDGTELPGCFKVYLPEPDGKFGMVLRFTIPEQAPGKKDARGAKRAEKEPPHRLRYLD